MKSIEDMLLESELDEQVFEHLPQIHELIEAGYGRLKEKPHSLEETEYLDGAKELLLRIVTKATDWRVREKLAEAKRRRR